MKKCEITCIEQYVLQCLILQNFLKDLCHKILKIKILSKKDLE